MITPILVQKELPAWMSFLANGSQGPLSDGYLYVFGTLDQSQNPSATSSDMYVARVLPGNVRAGQRSR